MNEVEEIKAKIDIVDLLSNYLTLKKAGANWKSICPFHQEKTPSLMVSREKQIFKCFGCGAGGDIFEFIKLIEHLEFPEALKLLAERCGVTLEKRKPLPGEAPDQKTKLFQINDLSARFFHKILLDHPVGQEALNYLKIRKINPQTIKNFLLGYAPQKEVLGNWLRTKGFTTQEIAQAGSPDRFRNRLIFPITNPLSKVIAFTGRILNPHDQPKYLNTPDTPIFHKSHVLYGLEKAKMAIKEKDQVILVEGQMDVISSYQAGITNVVASSGTALTEEHLKILSRYTPNIVFAFDQDSAGTEASKRAIDLAIKQDFNVRLAFLREVKDPGEAIEKDPQIFIEAITLSWPLE
jgi:DNA primase